MKYSKCCLSLPLVAVDGGKHVIGLVEVPGLWWRFRLQWRYYSVDVGVDSILCNALHMPTETQTTMTTTTSIAVQDGS